jgi:type IV secretion system protein VirB11
LSSYLEVYLAPLLPQLGRPDVTDIYINKPGELWVETLAGATERVAVEELGEEMLARLARQIASITHQGISREHPLLAATLPDGSRVQIVAPPATRGSMAIAIRKHVSADLSLAHYEASGAFSATTSSLNTAAAEQELVRLYNAGDWGGFLRQAVRARKSILISGGTSTGKTTFMNALMREIDATERLILIEDTPELVLRHANAVGLVAVRGALGEASVATNDLLTASLRMRPDRILLGELRGPEAFTFLRAVNTGHPGSMTTIHANSPDSAFEQLALLVLQSGTQMRREDIVSYLTRVVDVTVQLERRDGMRRLSQILWAGVRG